MKTTESGFIFKVVGGSDKVEAKKAPGGADAAFTLDLLAPYFVICEEDQFYKVTDLPAETVEQAEKGKVGYVLKDQVHPWPTREALNFSAVAFTGDRPEIVAWDDHDMLQKFLESGNINLGKPAYKEDLQSTLKRERATRPYPVLSSKTEKLRGTVDKRVFDVLLPAALPPETKVVIDTSKDNKDATLKKLNEAMTSATFAIAFDATGSMAPFAGKVAQDIKTAFESLPAEVQKASRIGFVFFRDEGDDEKYVIIKPQTVQDAVAALASAAKPEYMKGGGDPPEPVLDAVYIAHHLFPWAESAGADQSGGGRRILIAVLSDDAKPTTLGKIHNGVPPGIEPGKIASDLLTDSIPVISVQAGPTTGPNLVSVLTTIGEGSGGQFIEWGKGDDEERRRRVTGALAAQLTSRAEKTYAEGKKDLSKLEFDYRGYATIPLAVLDGEKLNRLRAAGIKFNVDPGKGGVLIREGFVLENPDLLEPQIQVEKRTLERLINLFAALGVTGVDVNAMKESAAQALAAIAGEDYDPKENIAVTIKKRLGIQFRTKLLEFNLEYLAGLTRDERLALTRRIQDASKTMTQFFDAHLEELDKSPAVWMPVSQLP
ncbi:VWA domain-containing protein [Bradyrhizobium sp. YR681]|uniref:VWA domain-containing protein n=1 Tax=Bradyrhizobium sp. YR681 TaxID=1144344 RepID=UPI000304D425|nr:VWA domain-containing protein [Bradyrhizobium sp. YR681]